MRRNSYHTSIKLAHALDIHRQWLPPEFLKSIPRSTAHAWKEENVEKFVGHQFSGNLSSNVDELKLMYDRYVSKEKRIFISYVRIKLAVIQILGKGQFRKMIRDNFNVVHELIVSVNQSLGVSLKNLQRMIDISPNTYGYLRKRSRFYCSNSATGLCVKQAPGQASKKEIETMGKLLRRKRFAHWPIASIWAMAVRKGLAYLSLSSWYHYNRKFSFRNTKKRPRHYKDLQPIRATRSNEIWHADVTIFKTRDDVRHYVYLIVDNFSRYILNYKVGSSANGAIRTQTLKEAILQEFGDSLLQDKSIDLIVDGGTENNNQTIQQYIKASQVNIDKKIALRDIEQSNSMVEASNKMLKHSYLYRKNISNRQELEEHLKESIFEFNNQRPHYSLDIYTPAEVHYNRKPKINKQLIREQVKRRIKGHQTELCANEC